VVNPFEDFKDYHPERRSLPLDHLAASHDEAVAALVAGYGRLVEHELKSLVWFVEHNRVIEAYKIACEQIRGLDYDVQSIEEFCYRLDSGAHMPYLISGPAGIYVSALCNQVAEETVVLRLDQMERQVHFVGYRLPYGKSLRIEGDAGNFTGSALQGGQLTVTGSAGNWTGAGMSDGRITIVKQCGRNTGEWMQGGEIWVGGRIHGLGRSITGRIYQAGEPVSGK
jgi:glutamate synthase domain-containing protein 3